MKVVIFSRYPESSARPRGGVESVTVVLAQALAGLDDMDIHLVTLERGARGARGTQDAGMTIHRLPASGWPQIADIHAGPGRKRILAKIRELSPDVVHSHETFGLGFGGADFPHVFTVHGFDHANVTAGREGLRWLRSRLWRIVEGRGLSRQSHIISISPYVRGMIEPQTKALIYDIDNPVEKRFFDVGRNESDGRVLCVGWISERKNTLGSVTAFAEAVKHGCTGKLAIAGEPKEEGYLERVRHAVQAKGIADHVEFLGHISHGRLAEQLAKASIMCLPSLQENAPMAIAEAMAVGVPVIASDGCGMPYMVEEGRSGFLVDPLNISQISDRIIRLLGAKKLRQEMGKRGREIAMARFHPDVVARKTKEVYWSAIKAKQGFS
jgi:glycosyltransferase involved in cell wall biosynthesis